MRERNEGERSMVHDLSQPLCSAATSTSPRTDDENLGSSDAPNHTALE
jgi:hypothetical protein